MLIEVTDLDGHATYVNPDIITVVQEDSTSLPSARRVLIKFSDKSAIFVKESVNEILHRVRIAYKERIEPRT